VTTPARATDSAWGRTYDINGTVVPSVTTVLSIVAKQALVSSAVKITAEAAVYQSKQLYAVQQQSGAEAALKWLKGIYRHQWDQKRDAGSAIHTGIHQDILGVEQWPTNYADHRVAWDRFKNECAPEFLMAEATVFSLKPGHAGTLDFIARLQDSALPEHLRGKRGLFDAKTGSSPRDGGIWFEEMIQLATYRNSPFLLMPDGSHQPMPAIDYAAVLHLDEKGYRLIEVPEANENAYRHFLYLLAVYQFQQGQAGAIGAEVKRG